jgi:hypothetical protein
LGKTQPNQAVHGEADTKPFAVKEYIGAMALEMARLARDEGDVRLAGLLEQAATVAGHPTT